MLMGISSLFIPVIFMATTSDTVAGPVADLGSGVIAFRAGDYEKAARTLARASRARLKNADYARFYLAESLFALNRPAAARGHYQAVARTRGSRFAQQADWRVADSLWLIGRTGAAAAHYRKVLPTAKVAGDGAVAHFRIAEEAARWDDRADRPGVAISARASRTARQHLQILLAEYPGHPLGVVAARRLALLSGQPPPVVVAPTVPVGAAGVERDPDAQDEDGESAPPAALIQPPVLPPDLPALDLSPATILRRAQILSDGRQWAQALAELDRLPPSLDGALAAERDYWQGKTKYRSRRDYPGAARLLLGVVDALPPDRAAWAAFHGARALSRVDRDDEAVVAYHKMIDRFPRSRFAPEARFLSGWLQFNRRRFREGLADLERTVRDYPRDRFSASAAWYLALSYHFLDQPAAAMQALETFEKRAHLQPGLRPVERVHYWRARFWADRGETAQAHEIWKQLVQKAPFGWYGLLAAARLIEAGHPDPLHLAERTEGAAPMTKIDGRSNRHPVVLRIDELLQARLPVDAGVELERGTTALLRDLGRGVGLTVVMDRAVATGSYARAHSLASVMGADLLDARPIGSARQVWQVAYPLAHQDLVEVYGPAAGNPPHFLFAIMRKESGFDPTVVSYADARGLLQMIPPTSQRVAAELGMDFRTETLFDPDTNIRLGAAYIGALHRKFKQQAILTAGAYNAGPKSMKRWCDRFGSHPSDEFVELVSFAQSREYIKRVMNNYARYRFLYANDRILPPLKLDCSYRNDGPDY